MVSLRFRRRRVSSPIQSRRKSSSRLGIKRRRCCRRWPRRADMDRKGVVLVIDNYDSFTYNLVQYLGELGEQVVVHRNNEITLEAITMLDPVAAVLSPGPGAPGEAGVRQDLPLGLGPALPPPRVSSGYPVFGEAYGCR